MELLIVQSLPMRLITVMKTYITYASFLIEWKSQAFKDMLLLFEVLNQIVQQLFVSKKMDDHLKIMQTFGITMLFSFKKMEKM